jgi:hypothetical protein
MSISNFARRFCGGHPGAIRSRVNDARFQALIADARTGDEIAIHSLWAENQFDFNRQGGALADDVDGVIGGGEVVT